MQLSTTLRAGARASIRSARSSTARNAAQGALSPVTSRAPSTACTFVGGAGPARLAANSRAFVSAPAGRRGLRVAAAAETLVEEPKPIYLKDYETFGFEIDGCRLKFELGEESSTVTSSLTTKRTTPGKDMVLDGAKDMELVSVKVDGAPVSDYEITAKNKLVLRGLPESTFELEIVTAIKPQENTSLEGLYKSSGNFCTQCEAEGFRRITYFPDRPDVMTTYTTEIIADKGKYPVLLSNGNLIDSGDLDGDKHFAVWEDPWNKPCYLFALVAGNLAVVEDKYTTTSGQDVTLRIYTEEHNIHKCGHAMTSLIASMKWDEDTYGLEYDLDLFNIVAVDDFNMGAMENKSLNIFNSRLVLATPETATDGDYARIEGVVGHEYFHNWTGNRVTCRDWFQLSLKEGLTVYRDQEFSADMNSRGVKRIEDVSMLRASQFSQDAGPMSHPIRPDSYIKMDNFYTVTIYEKGAEVVRMYRTLFGVDGFRKGMDLYFERHDGAAVTCDDFYKAMCDANGQDLGNFKNWYSQAGTPTLKVDGAYDEDAKTFTLKCEVDVPATPGQPKKEAQLVPLAMGLLGPDGSDLPLQLEGESAPSGTNRVLQVADKVATFTFVNVPARPVPSLLRGFSAPVKLVADQPEADLVFRLAHDSDEFNRWEAGQRLAKDLVLKLLDSDEKGDALVMSQPLVEAFRNVLTDKSLDNAFVARAISLPSEGEIADLVAVANPDAIHRVRKFVAKSLAEGLRAELEAAVAANEDAGDAYSPDAASCARRSLKNTGVAYLSTLDDPSIAPAILERFRSATNMTDQLAALASLNNKDVPERTVAMDEFYEQWKDEPLVLLKWLGLQASSNLPGNLENVKKLMEHPAFSITTPNCVYSLIGGFCASSVNFHNADGSGYEFLGDVVLKLDDINGQVASRMVGSFTRWKRYDAGRQAMMRAQLERMIAKEGLTDNVYEIASKSLEA